MQPSERPESRGRGEAASGGGHKDIPKKLKFPLGGEAPHQAPSTLQQKEPPPGVLNFVPPAESRFSLKKYLLFPPGGGTIGLQ